MTDKLKTGDPIFAAIDEHSRLVKASDRLHTALDLARSKAEKKHGSRPFVLIAWRHYSHIGGSEIDRAREEFLKLPAIDPKKIEKEYVAAKARYRAAERAELAWYKRSGLEPQRREYERTFAAERRAAVRLAKTMPSTPAGAAAMLAYVKADHIEDGPTEWHMATLETIIGVLAAWGKAPLAA
jgi:hypothetical protein